MDPLPFQRSLGLSWNLETDSFSFQVSHNEKPFTRRGILSTVNSLYDPLGFVAPITMQGKALIRELSSDQSEWDVPLPTEKEEKWKQWKQVQCLADTFWKRWRQEYLTTLQRRRKWTAEKPNVKVGDVVLLKDSQAHRNDWPVGLVVKTFPSTDKKVRKVELKIVKQGAAKVFLRPISEIVVLLSEAS